MDLEKFFDRVNHDILMSRLARHIEDKRILRLIRRYLQAGMMEDGLVTQRTEGTPQGGPLSPLLSNILLDELDGELKRRGHRFVRYADDCNIYVRSKAAGERVLASIERFLRERLRLTVNREKSAVDRPWNRKFLGYTVTPHRQPKLKVVASIDKPIEGQTWGDIPTGPRPQPPPRVGRTASSASRLGVVLPEIADSDHVRGTGPMDSTETAGHSVAAVEAAWTRARELIRRGLDHAERGHPRRTGMVLGGMRVQAT